MPRLTRTERKHTGRPEAAMRHGWFIRLPPLSLSAGGRVPAVGIFRSPPEKP